MRFSSIINCVFHFFSLIRPVWLKQWLLSKIQMLLSDILRIKSWMYQIRLSVCSVSGIEKNSGNRISILFVGNTKFPVYLRDIVFHEKPEVKQLGKVFIWRIKDLEKSSYDNVDAVMVSCDQFFQRFLFQGDYFVFPHMVDIVLDTSRSLNELIKELPHSAIEDVKKVNKQQFSFEISRDQRKLHRFYFDMYKPTLNKRIGETDVFIPDFIFLQYLWEIGYELMMISYRGKEVCGVFFKQEKNEILLKYAGVLHGKSDFVQRGAFSAFYYFFMIYAKEKKVDRVNFEGVRPFFYDGLFRYKIKWGSKIEHHWILPEIFGLKIVNRECESVKQFLVHNPFIGINEQDEFVGFIFVDEKKKRKKKDYEKKFLFPGIRKLRFISIE